MQRQLWREYSGAPFSISIRNQQNFEVFWCCTITDIRLNFIEHFEPTRSKSQCFISVSYSIFVTWNLVTHLFANSFQKWPVLLYKIPWANLLQGNPVCFELWLFSNSELKKYCSNKTYYFLVLNDSKEVKKIENSRLVDLL